MVSDASKLKAWRARGFRDPDGGVAALDWSDPIERVGIAAYAWTYNSPEAVSGMVNGEKGREELEKTWLALQPSDRQLYRKRAELAFAVGAQSPVSS